MKIDNLISKILIVDDVPTNINMLIEVLNNPNYEILAATNGNAALEVAESEIPDLILLDVVMPKMDGYAACKKIKENVTTKKIPIIFLTARASVEDETRGLELGAVDYITKPFSPPIVNARIRNHLELKKQRDILENLSAIDGLTGIPNRRRFDEYLEHEWHRCIRSASPLSLIMMDIDYFKRFNDNYGHLAGDDCLKQVAFVLKKSLERKTDFVARYGGEEFACILPMTDIKGAILMANRLRENIISLAIPHTYSTVADCLTISQGAATITPSQDSRFTTLINAADKALYEAKACGRNRVKVMDGKL